MAEDRNGDLWAIQAKAYDPKYRVSKKDVDKFLAGIRPQGFAYRMLIATTDLIDRTGERTIQQQEKRSGFFRLNDLRAAAVDWPASPEQLRPAKERNPATPRPHPGRGDPRCAEGFTTSDRGQLVMACGTGKTLTGLFITEELKAQRTLVLLPSLSLLKQTLNEWRANCATDFHVSAGVFRRHRVRRRRHRDRPYRRSRRSGYYRPDADRGLPAPQVRPFGGALDVSVLTADPGGVQTRQSPGIRPRDRRRSAPRRRSGVLGLRHRARRRCDQERSAAIHDGHPARFTGRVRKAAQEADYEVASMDDGRSSARSSTGCRSVRPSNVTCSPTTKLSSSVWTTRPYQEWAEKGALVTRDGTTIDNAATLAGQIGLAKAMRKYDLRRVISFHSRVKRAREFATSLPDVIDWMPARQRPKGTLWSDVATGEMPAGDRYVLLQRLGRLDDTDRGLLANARCLSGASTCQRSTG